MCTLLGWLVLLLLRFVTKRCRAHILLVLLTLRGIVEYCVRLPLLEPLRLRLIKGIHLRCVLPEYLALCLICKLASLRRLAAVLLTSTKRLPVPLVLRA